MYLLSNLIQNGKIKAVINFGNKINIIMLAYILEICFKLYHINIKTQKINGFICKIFKMVLASF